MPDPQCMCCFLLWWSFHFPPILGTGLMKRFTVYIICWLKGNLVTHFDTEIQRAMVVSVSKGFQWSFECFYNFLLQPTTFDFGVRVQYVDKIPGRKSNLSLCSSSARSFSSSVFGVWCDTVCECNPSKLTGCKIKTSHSTEKYHPLSGRDYPRCVS